MGAISGIFAEYLLDMYGFHALLSYKLISVKDDWDGTYYHSDRILLVTWSIFGLVALCLLGLRRIPRFKPFCESALVTHAAFGGLWSIFVTCAVFFA